jgi:hypothetical protein
MPVPRLPLLTALALLAAACGDTPKPVPGEPTTANPEVDPTDPAPRRGYERAVVFVSVTGDSLMVVPWVVEAETGPGGVDRSARGWLARGGSWEAFLDTAWTSPESREPWKVLPHGPFRILVGEGDRLDRIYYDDGNRRLEVSLEEPVVEWTGNRGGSFHVLEGGLVLGDRRVPGRVLDVSQGIRVSEGRLGDWLYLVSGDSVAAVIQAPLYSEEQMTYQGWARDGGEELQWPEVRVRWEESRAFEPARRDVPGRLVIETRSGSLGGELHVVAMQIQVGEGPGPLLPVDGIMELEGYLRIQEREVPVRGVLRHRQP